MKIFSKFTIVLALFFLFSADSFAQKGPMASATNAFNAREYYKAIELYKKAYTKARKKEDKALIVFQTAECYRWIFDYKQAEAWYSKAIKANYPDPIAILYLADAMKKNEKYNEALIEYNNYKKANPSDPRGEAGAKSCELAQKWKDNPTRYKVENLVLVNTKEPEFAPSYADKKYNKLYFTSMRPGVIGNDVDQGMGENFSDIFETAMDKNGKWSTPTSLPEPLNTKDNEGLSTVTKKGDVIYFSRCIIEKNKKTTNQLWTASKKGTAWGPPEKLPFCVDSVTYNSPFVSADGSTLFFSANIEGGQGKNDLWMVKFDKKEKTWSKPVNLGSSINTPENEVYPFLHDDGTLYFSSNGHLGMGGFDVFKAEKKGENQWGNVTNMKYPINSAGDDIGIIFEGKKERGYLASDREGTKGSFDLWSFVLPPLIYTIEGVITDCKFKEVIPGVVVKLVGSDGSSVETKTDIAGYYKFAEKDANNRLVNQNTSYTITTQVGVEVKTVQAPLGFINNPDKIKETTVGVEVAKIFKHDFCLAPIIREMHFPEVLYDLGSAALRPESKDSLNVLYETLINNPNITIELSSHTDYRGSDQANQKLSEARAKSCVDYLISKGINPERMTAKGYGESRPLEISSEDGKAVLYSLSQAYIDKVTKGKSKQEYEALMQKNRRTVFTVLRRDYVDPNAPKIEQVKPKTEEEEEVE